MTHSSDKMDAESLSFIPKVDGDANVKKGEATYAPLPPKQIMIFFMGASAILLLTCLAVVFQPTPVAMNLNISSALAVPEEFAREDSSLSKKWKPFPKKTDGSVSYSSYATEKDGVVYKREFHVPCNDGILAFNIGPAPADQSYDFEIYDAAYIWDNNNNMCFLYPMYKAYQLGHSPFWESSDPTYQLLKHVKGDKWFRISSKVNGQAHAKTIDDAVRKQGGDYVIMARGHFWTPNFMDTIHHQVHQWTKGTDIDAAVEEFFVTMELE